MWQQALDNDDVFEAFKRWVLAKAVEVTHVRWLRGGISGSAVAMVDYFPLPSGPRVCRILIDMGRFTGSTPVSRDAAKLTLSLAEHWLKALTPGSPARQALCGLIVNPQERAADSSTAGFAPTIKAIHRVIPWNEVNGV